MAPEFLNRLDAIVVFDPLDEMSIRKVAEKMVAEAAERLRARGYRIEVDAEAEPHRPRWLHPAFGARHVRRAIEAHTERLAALGAGSYRIAGANGALRIQCLPDVPPIRPGSSALATTG